MGNAFVPKISVVMTVFNEGLFLKEAIDSILGQSFEDFEFIIVDNASTDKTKEIISFYKDPRIIFIENDRNLGQTKALNVGIKKSRGEFIARMDADDVSLRERFEIQYDFLMKNRDVGLLGSWHEEISGGGRHLKFFKLPTDPLEIKCNLMSPGELGCYCISHPTVIIKRSALEEVGFYDESHYAQDYDLWVRICGKYKIANIGRYLVKHRISEKQQTHEFKDAIKLDCQRIVSANISRYLPNLDSKSLISLTKMLQFKPQDSKEGGKRVLDAFNLFFKEYTKANQDGVLLKKIKDKLTLYYLFQLMKTNKLYALRKFLELIIGNPDFLLEAKLYRKFARSMHN